MLPKHVGFFKSFSSIDKIDEIDRKTKVVSIDFHRLIDTINIDQHNFID